MLITISGYPGSGKSTVGKLLAKKLHLRHYSIGAMRRKMAQERGMTLEEFNQLGIKKSFTDRTVDEWARQQARKTGRGIFEGRTMFYFVPDSIKIFLDVSRREAAKRIASDRAHLRKFEAGSDFRDLKMVEQALKRRIQSDTIRYRKHYGINIFSKRQYDLWLDTTNETPTQTLHRVLAYIRKTSPQIVKVEKHRISRRLSPFRSKKLRKSSASKKR